MSFSSLGLSSSLVDHLLSVGFKTPTPVQIMVIPKFLRNADIMASAQTGTGKTGAFLLPAIDYLLHARKREKLPRILILEPTRELATQIYEEFQRFNKDNILSAVVLVGGESNILQERALAKGVDLMIATPGRLMDLYERNKIMLYDIHTLIIDEADRMLDMGFIPQIDRLIDLLQPYRQTLLLSATFTDDIEQLGNKYLTNPQRISVEAVNQTAATIEQFIYKISPRQKTHLLEHVLKEQKNKRGVIFCNKKRDIDEVVNFVSELGIHVVEIHGDLTQTHRNKTLEMFKNGEATILVASDVAARGLDIQDLEIVINYDTPINADTYVHRIGRTGRAGNKGTAYTFVTPKDKLALTNVELLIGQKITQLAFNENNASTKSTAGTSQKPEKSQKLEKKHPSKKQSTPPTASSVIQAMSDEPVLGFGHNIPAFMTQAFVHTL